MYRLFQPNTPLVLLLRAIQMSLGVFARTPIRKNTCLIGILFFFFPEYQTVNEMRIHSMSYLQILTYNWTIIFSIEYRK
ncbi:hypothetical protein BDF14DRAFT_1782447 [Spinellus fusiger]|nr:hypothetical protein BDF14DRAFT_1782447 [Spinellus fusiger]